jgi:DNA-binding NarL/FixJ family response regulator
MQKRASRANAPYRAPGPRLHAFVNPVALGHWVRWPEDLHGKGRSGAQRCSLGSTLDRPALLATRGPADGLRLAICGQTNSLAAAALRTILLGDLGFAEVQLTSSFDQVEAQVLGEAAASLLVLDAEIARGAIPSRLRTLRETQPDLRIVIIAEHLAREDILLALASGVQGYVGARQPLAEIVAALRDVATGRISVAAEVARVPAPDTAPRARPMAPNVSRRQQDVLRLLAAGSTNKDIARALRLSEGTVKAHIAAAYRKLGVHNRTQAAAALNLLSIN